MNLWMFVFAALAAFPSIANSDKKIVCYFGSWAVYRPNQGKFDISDIDPTLCTHMIYAFVGMDDKDNSIKVLDSWQDLPDNGGKNGFGRFNDLRKQSPGTKTLVAIGGWNEGSTKYSTVFADQTRAKFVKNAVNFVQKYGFDGLDLDWEYPNQRGGKQEDVANFVSLVKELKTEFDKHGLIISAAVAAAEPSASQSYDIAEISKYLDFINIMTYDFHGSWDPFTGHNAPLYPHKDESGNNRKLNVDASVRYWLSRGCPPEKLILGVPFYGRSFTLADKSQHGLGAATIGPGTQGPYTREAGTLGYNEICVDLKNGWRIVRHKEQRVPYAFKDNQWVGYDDVTSVKEKTDYIRSLNLGGAMVWSIDTDDFRANCGEKYPLLKTLNTGLRSGVKLQ